jgi:HK97 family phage major capsid protein
MITDLRNEDKDLRNAAIAASRELYPNDAVRITAIYKEIKELEASIQLDQEGDAMRTRLDATVGEPNRPDPDDRPGASRFIADAKKSPPNPKDMFGSLGEQCMAVFRHSVGRGTDPRLFRAAATGLSEAVPSGGGLLLEDEFSKDILSVVFEESNIPGMTQRLTLGANTSTMKIPAISETSRADGSRRGGVLGYWVDEAADITKSKPSYKRIELTPNKQAVLIYATDEMLEDVGVLNQQLSTLATQEIQFMIADAIVNGDGSGKPQGILGAPSNITASKEAGQLAGTLIYENIVAMWARMIASSYTNAVWLIDQSITTQLFTMNLAVGTGGQLVYMPPGGASVSPYGSLFGRPVLPVEHCQALGTEGDIILADFSQYYLADKGAIQSDSSIHVEFVAGETVFRFTYRVDGQPWWTSDITPKSGGDTLSPFITLETRS